MGIITYTAIERRRLLLTSWRHGRRRWARHWRWRRRVWRQHRLQLLCCYMERVTNMLGGALYDTTPTSYEEGHGYGCHAHLLRDDRHYALLTRIRRRRQRRHTPYWIVIHYYAILHYWYREYHSCHDILVYAAARWRQKRSATYHMNGVIYENDGQNTLYGTAPVMLTT